MTGVEILFIFMLCSIFVYTYFDKINKLFICYWGIGFFLILIAALRNGNVVHDYDEYISIYNNIEDYNTIEYSFKLIRYVVKAWFNQPLGLFIIYAILGVSLKLKAIYQLSSFYFLSVIIYISNFFLLHEMTQIRVGVAAGFFLLALKPLAERQFKKFILYILIASFFHYSAIILFPFWFITNKKFNKKEWYFYLSLIPLGYLFTTFTYNILIYIPIENIRLKLEMYKSLQESGAVGFSEANLFNPYFLFKCVIYYFIYFKYKQLENCNRYFPLLLKIYGFSLFIFPAFSFIPIVGYRLSELTGCVEIILYPLLVYCFTPKIIAKGIVIFIGLLLLLVNIFHKQLILFV